MPTTHVDSWVEQAAWEFAGAVMLYGNDPDQTDFIEVILQDFQLDDVLLAYRSIVEAQTSYGSSMERHVREVLLEHTGDNERTGRIVEQVKTVTISTTLDDNPDVVASDPFSILYMGAVHGFLVQERYDDLFYMWTQSDDAKIRVIEEICESPIEKKLARELVVGRGLGLGYKQVLPSAYWHGGEEQRLGVVQLQRGLGRTRVDMLVLRPMYEPGIIVECDGHDFHDRTKTQASRDRQRDRQHQLEGYRVLRFTGSDIHRNVAGCADNVIEHLRTLHPRRRSS